MHIKTFFWLNGASLLLLGALLFFFPELTLRWIMILVALQSLLSAMFVFFSLWNFDRGHKLWSFLIAIFQLIFALLLLIYPQFGNFLLSLIVVVFALGVISFGIVLVYDALRIRRLKVASWWVLLLLAFIVIVFGLFILTNAFLTYLSLLMLLGLSFCVLGVNLLIRGFKIPKNQIVIDFSSDE